MTGNQRRTSLALATTPRVVRRAALTALIVGCLLTAINHGAALVRGEIDGARAFQIALTAIVPYGVSTISSVVALRDSRRVDDGSTVTHA